MFTVDSVCDEPVATDSGKDMSSLVVCWLADDIDTSLPDLIRREITFVKWDEHAVDGNV